MHVSKIELERCFLCSIDSAKSFVDYNEYIIDLDGEMCQYIISLFARNFDNTSAKKSFYNDESFLAQIIPDKVENFDAFVDVVADELHTLVGESADLPSGSGLFIWATVEEQPIIGFFKLNYQNKYTCVVDEEDSRKVKWQKVYRLLPGLTQKEYDYFFINILDKTVWMSDSVCHIGAESFNYMADKILKLEETLHKSEKEMVQVLETAAINTIKQCYAEDAAPKKMFEYRMSMADEVADYGNISPKSVEDRVFADNEQAKQVYRSKLTDMDVPPKPVPVSSKTKRQMNKKQKIVTESGIEILVPIEYLEDSSVFEFRKYPTGKISIVINDVSGEVK